MLNHQNHRIQQQQQQQQQQHQNRQRLSVTFNLNQNHQPQQQHQQQNDSLNNNNNNNKINDDRNHNHIKDDDVLRRNSFNTIINNNDCTLLPTAKYPYYCLKDSDYYYGQVSNRRYSSESAAFNHYHSRNHGANAAIAANNVTANASSLANDKQSSLKSIISRAKSDILINTIGQIGPNSTASKISAVDNNRLTSNNTHPSNDIESKRTNATLKKLARYINVRPRLMVKQHKYQRLSIVWAYHVRPIKCHICTLNIYFYCYECLQCKLTGHKKCLQNISVTCPNKLMPPRLNVFGLEISDNNQISDVLYTCIAEIERRPIHTIRGIYKIEGNIEMIENLCLSFEFGSHLIDLSQSSPHDLASVVKHYLICISTPIFNDHIQKELITIGSEWPARKIPYTQSGITILVFELRRLVSYLSPTYRNNLAFLIYHFKRIVDRQHITEMTANSLAIIFAPIIFRDESNLDFSRKYNSPNNRSVQRSFSLKNDDKNISKSSPPTTILENDNQSFNFSLNNMINKKNRIKINFNHNHHDNNDHTTTTTTTINNKTSSKMHILLDVHLKIRVIELMICYANDIFANLD